MGQRRAPRNQAARRQHEQQRAKHRQDDKLRAKQRAAPQPTPKRRRPKPPDKPWRTPGLQPKPRAKRSAERERRNAVRRKALRRRARLQRGVLETWNDARGFGFVGSDPRVQRSRRGQRLSSPPPAFVHAKDFPFYQRRPRRGDRVRFVFRYDAQGRACATEPRLLSWTASTALLTLLAGAVLVCGWIGGLLLRRIPWTLPTAAAGAYGLFSVSTFSAYLVDKQRAVQGHWRIPEASLHTLELLGGWPGGLAAQRLLAHKSRKAAFQRVFWSIAGLHVAAWAAWAWLRLR